MPKLCAHTPPTALVSQWAGRRDLETATEAGVQPAWACISAGHAGIPPVPMQGPSVSDPALPQKSLSLQSGAAKAVYCKGVSRPGVTMIPTS